MRFFRTETVPTSISERLLIVTRRIFCFDASRFWVPTDDIRDHKVYACLNLLDRANAGAKMAATPEYCRREVKRWLALKLTNGRCSSQLIDQLASHMLNRTLDVFAVYDEIGTLEGAPITRPSSTKPASPFSGSVLRGLWHKHFSAPAFIAQNLLNHWSTKRVAAVLDNLGANDSIPSDKKAAFLVHHIVLEGYQERHRQGQVTGEWIVFIKQSPGNVYLTLATHSEADEAIRARADLAAAEFTDLRI